MLGPLTMCNVELLMAAVIFVTHVMYKTYLECQCYFFSDLATNAMSRTIYNCLAELCFAYLSVIKAFIRELSG